MNNSLAKIDGGIPEHDPPLDAPHGEVQFLAQPLHPSCRDVRRPQRLLQGSQLRQVAACFM